MIYNSEKLMTSSNILYTLNINFISGDTMICKQEVENVFEFRISEQGSTGIRQWPISWCNSPIIIHKIKPYVDFNLWLKRFGTQLNEPFNQNSIKVPSFYYFLII